MYTKYNLYSSFDISNVWISETSFFKEMLTKAAII